MIALRPFAALAGTLFVLSVAAPVAAGELPAISRITAVEVYPDGATVARAAEIAVPAGETVVILSDLPSELDPDSVRVEAEAASAMEVISVDVRYVEPQPGGRPTEIAQRLKALRRDHAAVKDRIATAEGQLRFINNMIEAAPRQIFDRKGEQPAPDWSELLTRFGASLGTLRETIRSSKAEAEDIDTEIKRLLQAQQEGFPEDRPTHEARIAINAERPMAVSLRLRYATGAASWRPVYDARLSMTGATALLELIRRAVVSQSSGEDWSDVALTLSTARPGGQAEAPVLPPLILRIARPQPVGQARMRGAPSEADAEVAAAPMMEPALGAGMPKQASERLATLETRGFDIVYRIPGHVTVSGDGTAKTLKVASQSIDPELVVRAVPALDPTAYLTVRFANDGSGPILPGPVQLFRDGVFVGRSTVRFIAPKEEAVFGFGADPAVVVERVTLERSEGERGVLSTDKVDQRRFKITVTNRHERPMTVEIEDRLPQSENEKITVQPVETTEPSARDPQGRRGILVWKEVYAANESREILIGYVVRWPEGERVIWQDRGER